MSNYDIKLLKENEENTIKFNKEINEPLPNPHFTMCIIGPSMSGKGLTAVNLFYRSDMLGDIYDYIIYVSPTIDNDTNGAIVRESKKTIVYNDPNDLGKIVNEIMDLQSLEEGDLLNNKPKILLIADDCLGYLDSRKSEINKFISKNRHYSCSCVFLIQNFKMLNNCLRGNSHYFIVKRINNYKEEAKIFEEIGPTFCSIKDFKNYYEYCTKDSRFDFLYCCMRERKLYKNFTELIFDGSNQK